MKAISMDIHSIRNDKRHRRRYNIGYINAKIYAISDIGAEIRAIGAQIKSIPAQKQEASAQK